MDQTILQTRIEQRAYEALKREYMEWRSKMVSGLGRGLMIQNSSASTVYPEYLPQERDWKEKLPEPFVKKLIERKGELEKIETDNILQRLTDLNYLFQQ